MSRTELLYREKWSVYDTDDLFSRRREMVEQQLASRGITDERVLDVMRFLPRHAFVPDAFENRAYDDSPVEIGGGQTISQPYMVALMTELLDIHEDHRVLDVGTGSGYQAAVLALLAREIHTIEIQQSLLESAETHFAELELTNIHAHCGDGSQGLVEFAPFDRIVVAAGTPVVPDALRTQLSPNDGKMVIPVGPRTIQDLLVVTRSGNGYTHSKHGGCIFVPLLGRHGWS